MLKSTIRDLPLASPGSLLESTDLATQVGNTPLLRLRRIEEQAQLSSAVELYGKAEWFNPSGSVKDRPALNIIRTAEREGHLKPGMTLLDSTSGNMGISYAMFGASMGYRVALAIPENASKERLAILRAFGADLKLTSPLEGSDGAIKKARLMAQNGDDQVFYAAQYDNPANWRAHYHTTASEIWTQSQGRVTHFIAGLGTSGTFMGASRRLKELDPAIQAISMQPDSPFNGLEGLKHMNTAITPGIYDPEIADFNLEIRTEEAYDMARELARTEGLFVGFSAAAAVEAAARIGRELSYGVIVTVLPDSGYRYLSERFWQGEQ